MKNYTVNHKFDDLRPYYDEEIPAAMQRIAHSEHLPLIAEYVYPGRNLNEIQQMIQSYTTISEFQFQVMKAFNEQVIARSISNLTNSGIDNLDKNQRYLFVSNHRDIMLDATILQYILHLAGHPTSEISFGSNLMKPQLVVDIGKSNKMYKIIRGGSMKDFYTNSLHLSEYIHYALHTKKESVWIAQGNGRTKNGADITEPGIIKMFYLSDQTNPAQTLASLNIVPVSISYQWETCDQLKALELYITQRDGKYVKQPDEDLHSILNGINQYKGHVHIHFGAPITTSDLAPFENQPHNTFNKNVAALITHRINSGYQLSCNNYIAADLISQSTQYADKYTDDERQKFLHHYHSATNIDVEDKALLLNIFLNIYANPVKNHPHHEK